MIQSRQRFSEGEPERSPPDLIYVDTSTLDPSKRQMDGSRFIKSPSIQDSAGESRDLGLFSP